jgi:CubicO group peptidase (beta-lactamase class C family)
MFRVHASLVFATLVLATPIAQAQPVAPVLNGEQRSVEAIRADLRQACDNGSFSVAALVARGASVLVETACGEASMRYHVANTVDTRFNLGSMDIMFTAVTIAQLLSHTSGLGNYFNKKFWNSSRALYREVDDFKALIKDSTLAFEPGTRFHMGYIPSPESALEWTENTFLHVIKGGPAGGGFSTVGDLHRFALALQTGKLLKPSSLEQMWQQHSEVAYGYGFDVKPGDAGRQIGHSGGFPGINGIMTVYLDQGYTAVVLSNRSNGAVPIAQRIAHHLARFQAQAGH